MTIPTRLCGRSQVEHIRKFLAYAKLSVNEARYYPPSYGYQYLVALALYSKCITVAEATLVLLDAGFSDEAFGMTRTLVDIFLTLRYITNKETHERGGLPTLTFVKQNEGAPSFRVFCERVGTTNLDEIRPLYAVF